MKSSVLITAFLVCEIAVARFQQPDADKIDPEQRVGTEYYNDEISYRYPFSWERHWAAKELGLRANGGSYNAKRFMYYEDIKLTTPEEHSVSLQYNQHRYLNLLSDLADRELRIRFNNLRPVYLAFLVDGDSYKDSADFGMAVSLWPRSNRYFEIYTWSVDRLYNVKASDSGSKQHEQSWTYGAKYEWVFTDRFGVRLKWELDTPLEWFRNSKQYTYSYERQTQDFQVDYGNRDDGWLLRGIYQHETKKEAKEWLLADSVQRTKTMEREADWYELLANYAGDNWDVTGGIVYLTREVDYEHIDLVPAEVNEEEAEGSPEDNSPDTIRKEWAFYTTYHHQMSKGSKHWWQYGLHFNQMRIEERSLGEELRLTGGNEVKVQLAWQYDFADRVSCFINTSWDLDELQKRYPYEGSGNAFKPWGGGNLQFIAMF